MTESAKSAGSGIGLFTIHEPSHLLAFSSATFERLVHTIACSAERSEFYIEVSSTYVYVIFYLQIIHIILPISWQMVCLKIP